MSRCAVHWIGKGPIKAHRPGRDVDHTACGTRIRPASVWYAVTHSTEPIGPRCKRCFRG
jgi:hypothetical protein